MKQKDKLGRPNGEAFETAMHRSERERGFFVEFHNTDDALREIARFFNAVHAVIVPPEGAGDIGRADREEASLTSAMRTNHSPYPSNAPGKVAAPLKEEPAR